MGKPIRILLQTTIPRTENDWTIERFSLLREYLSSLSDANGDRLIEVMARNLASGWLPVNPDALKSGA